MGTGFSDATTVVVFVRRNPPGTRSSTIAFHAPQSWQRPAHLACLCPHCWQTYWVLSFPAIFESNDEWNRDVRIDDFFQQNRAILRRQLEGALVAFRN